MARFVWVVLLPLLFMSALFVSGCKKPVADDGNRGGNAPKKDGMLRSTEQSGSGMDEFMKKVNLNKSWRSFVATAKSSPRIRAAQAASGFQSLKLRFLEDDVMWLDLAREALPEHLDKPGRYLQGRMIIEATEERQSKQGVIFEHRLSFIASVSDPEWRFFDGTSVVQKAVSYPEFKEGQTVRIDASTFDYHYLATLFGLDSASQVQAEQAAKDAALERARKARESQKQ